MLFWDAYLLAVKLGDCLLRKVLVGICHKGTAAALAIGVSQDVKLQDLANGGEQAEELLLTCLQVLEDVRSLISCTYNGAAHNVPLPMLCGASCSWSIMKELTQSATSVGEANK